MKTLKTLIEELITHECSTDAKLDLLTAIQIACENDEIYQAAIQVRAELPVDSDIEQSHKTAHKVDVKFVNGSHLSGVLLEENGDEKLRASDSEIMTDYIKTHLV